jgi:hypothetical protein
MPTKPPAIQQQAKSRSRLKLNVKLFDKSEKDVKAIEIYKKQRK